MASEETTLVSVIATLRERGYTEDFNIIGNEIAYGNGKNVETHELVIDKIYRFEGNQNDVDDAAILYAITCHTHGKKGILVNGYGTSSDVVAEAILKQITHS